MRQLSGRLKSCEMFEEVRGLKRRRSIVVRYDDIRCVRPFDLLLMNEEGILRKMSLQGFLWMCEIVLKDGSLGRRL